MSLSCVPAGAGIVLSPQSLHDLAPHLIEYMGKAQEYNKFKNDYDLSQQMDGKQ